MLTSSKFRGGASLLSLILCAAAVVTFALFSARPTEPRSQIAADPWDNRETMRPGDLVAETARAKNANAQTIIYVGFRTLFEGGHVPGAVFHGTASTEKGLAELKKWLADLPRSANLVIYCGCCPFDRCPNIRPAYKALHEMGFAHVRVLILPTSFAADWVEKGYAMEKGLGAVEK